MGAGRRAGATPQVSEELGGEWQELGALGVLDLGGQDAQRASFSSGYKCSGLVLNPGCDLHRPPTPPLFRVAVCPSICSSSHPLNKYLVFQACSEPDGGRKWIHPEPGSWKTSCLVRVGHVDADWGPWVLPWPRSSPGGAASTLVRLGSERIWVVAVLSLCRLGWTLRREGGVRAHCWRNGAQVAHT